MKLHYQASLLLHIIIMQGFTICLFTIITFAIIDLHTLLASRYLQAIVFIRFNLLLCNYDTIIRTPQVYECSLEEHKYSIRVVNFQKNTYSIFCVSTAEDSLELLWYNCIYRLINARGNIVNLVPDFCNYTLACGKKNIDYFK